MDRQLFRIMVGMCMLAAGCAPKGDTRQSSSGAAQDDTCVASEKDRHFRLEGTMRDNWRTMNRTVGARPESGYSGAQLLGLPVSTLFKKVIPDNANNHPSNGDGTSDFQCFERGILNTVTNDAGLTVYVGALLGSMAWAEKNGLKATDQSKQPLPESRVGSYDQSQGGTVDCGNAIISFYNQGGGQLTFGLPMSNVITGVASDGKTYQMQYFQRYVMECHPASDGLYDVMLGLLGSKYCTTVAAGHQLPPRATPTPQSENGSDVQVSNCVPGTSPQPQPAPTPVADMNVGELLPDGRVRVTNADGTELILSADAAAFIRAFLGPAAEAAGGRQITQNYRIVYYSNWNYQGSKNVPRFALTLPEQVNRTNLDGSKQTVRACENVTTYQDRRIIGNAWTLALQKLPYPAEDPLWEQHVWAVTFGELAASDPYRKQCWAVYSRTAPDWCLVDQCANKGTPNWIPARNAVEDDIAAHWPEEAKEWLRRGGGAGIPGLPAPSQTVAGVDGWTVAILVGGAIVIVLVVVVEVGSGGSATPLLLPLTAAAL